MGLNVSVILTNIIGFAIVVAILKKYAWGPILDLLDQRRQTIEQEFETAEHTREEAEHLKEEFELQLTNIKVIEREKVQEAVQRGEEIAHRIEQEARAKADTTLQRAQEELQREMEKAQLELRDRVVDLAIRSAEKLVRKELDDETHRRLIREYIDSLGSVSDA